MHVPTLCAAFRASPAFALLQAFQCGAKLAGNIIIEYRECTSVASYTITMCCVPDNFFSCLVCQWLEKNAFEPPYACRYLMLADLLSNDS